MTGTTSKDDALRILEQKIYSEIPAMLAGKGLSHQQIAAVMDDRKESVDLIVRLIKQYGIQERIDGLSHVLSCEVTTSVGKAIPSVYVNNQLNELTALKDK